MWKLAKTLPKHVKHDSRHGFTIVELLIVIVVIGILATITVVAYSGIQTSAGVVVLKSDLNQAQTQLELDRINDSTYPTTKSGLPKSDGTNYEYTKTGTDYCLTASSDRAKTSFHIDSTNGAIADGACSGDTGYEGGGEAGNPPAAVVPSAPTAVNAIAGDAQSTVNWVGSNNDGGSAITGYVVTSNPGEMTATVGSTETTTTITGLNNGTSYTFTVKTTNAVGSSLASVASNATTPIATPNTAVTMTPSQVWTPQQVYDWNPNWSNFTYTPPGGSFGSQAINLNGVSYRWKHYNDTWPVDISIAKPSPSNLSSLESSAQSWGTTASWGTGINGYFAVKGSQGVAQVFKGGYWVVVADVMSSSSGDISQIVNDVIGNLP